MRVYCDLHIHTAASPCGDELMSPHNIVNMAKLKGLDIIAITDHQTSCNVQAVKEVGQQNGLLVIPGLEIECAEEFHLIALLPSCEAAKHIEADVRKGMLKIKNKPEVFGHQLCLNEQSEVIDEIQDFLLVATNQTAYEIAQKVRAVGGVIYPAHIDRNSYSIISQLGVLPEKPSFTALEISKEANLEQYMRRYKEYHIIQSSDAHYLQDINERQQCIELSEVSISALFNWFND